MRWNCGCSRRRGSAAHQLQERRVQPAQPGPLRRPAARGQRRGHLAVLRAVRRARRRPGHRAAGGARAAWSPAPTRAASTRVRAGPARRCRRRPTSPARARTTRGRFVDDRPADAVWTPRPIHAAAVAFDAALAELHRRRHRRSTRCGRRHSPDSRRRVGRRLAGAPRYPLSARRRPAHRRAGRPTSPASTTGPREPAARQPRWLATVDARGHGPRHRRPSTPRPSPPTSRASSVARSGAARCSPSSPTCSPSTRPTVNLKTAVGADRGRCRPATPRVADLRQRVAALPVAAVRPAVEPVRRRRRGAPARQASAALRRLGGRLSADPADAARSPTCDSSTSDAATGSVRSRRCRRWRRRWRRLDRDHRHAPQPSAALGRRRGASSASGGRPAARRLDRVGGDHRTVGRPARSTSSRCCAHGLHEARARRSCAGARRRPTTPPWRSTAGSRSPPSPSARRHRARRFRRHRARARRSTGSPPAHRRSATSCAGRSRPRCWSSGPFDADSRERPDRRAAAPARPASAAA